MFFEQALEEIKTNVRVIAYAPTVFMHLRAQDGINDEEMVQSLNPFLNRHQIFKANQGQKHNSGGKSGSFFFFTEDRQYIIKTIKKSELF